MQKRDERDDQQERETENPHQPTEPNRQEQQGMICKPSDVTSQRRERVRGIMI